MVILRRNAYPAEAVKDRRRVIVMASDELKAMLDRPKAENEARKAPVLTIPTNSRGKPWTSDGFRPSWGKAVVKAG
jgi:DNA-binding protein H-NS